MPQSLNEQLSRSQQIAALEKDWATNPRWKGIKRGYSAADVVRLRGSVQIEHSLAKRGSEKLWRLINGEAKKGYVNSFGAISAGQAMQQAKAGLEAVYLSGWQVAADGNTSETMYPDQSLYAYDSVPAMVRRINNTFRRADEIQWQRGIEPGAFLDMSKQPREDPKPAMPDLHVDALQPPEDAVPPIRPFPRQPHLPHHWRFFHK